MLHFVVLFGGSLLAYRVADFLGRRKELITAAALYIFGALVSGVAPDYFSLIRGVGDLQHPKVLKNRI